MWAFLILVIVFIFILFVLPFLTAPPPSIPQPLALSPDSRTMFINSTETTSVNFSVENLNLTSAITANVTTTLSYFSNSTTVPANGNITLTVYGVYTGTSFSSAIAGSGLTFQPGGNTMVVDIKAVNAKPGIYTIGVALST